jgi:hypothetical protein
MRKFLIAILALLVVAPMALRSQNVMVIHLKNGRLVDLAFKYQPVVTFTETDVVLTTSNGLTFQYPLASLTKFTFVTKDITDPEIPPTTVDEVESRKVTFLIDEYTVTISGASADLPVRLLSADGRQLNVYKTDKSGTATFSIEDLPEGTYIISSQEITFKVLKK